MVELPDDDTLHFASLSSVSEELQAILLDLSICVADSSPAQSVGRVRLTNVGNPETYQYRYCD